MTTFRTYPDQTPKTVDAVIFPIPRIVFCAKEGIEPGMTYTCFYQPATESLLPKVMQAFADCDFVFVPVPSNVEACQQHLTRPSTTVAVTNEICAEAFALEIHLALNHHVNMPWLFMQKNDDYTVEVEQ